MKILLLTHKLPYPLHDGYNLHNWNYVRCLRAEHEIHLVSLGRREDLPDEVADWFASVRTVPARPDPRLSLGHKLAHVFDLDEFFDRDPAVVRAADAVLAEHEIDVVWTSGAKMLVYSDRLDLPTLGDIADEAAKEALHDLKQAVGAPYRVPRLLRAVRGFVNTWRFQRHFLAHTRVCTVVSEIDKATLAKNCPELDVRVVPNGVDAQFYAPQVGEDGRPVLVFEGAMDFRPNVEGITAFVADTLPLIRAQVPTVELVLVGRNPAPEVSALAGKGITVTGFVDDVRPYVDRAAVFVCPLRRGAGIKNKILQAWAMEKPVVATPVSCGGLEHQDGKNILVRESPQDVARAVVELLSDAPRRAELGRAARKTVLERYSWERQARKLEGILSDIAQQIEVPV